MEWKKDTNRLLSEDDQGHLLAEATYVPIEDNRISINHTYVDPSLRGQGVASEMMQELVEDLEKQGIQVQATCPYAIKWLKKRERGQK